MRQRLLAAACLSAALLLNSSTAAAQSASPGSGQAMKQKSCISPAKIQLQNDLRKLWIDHVVWTRNYIVSAVAGADDQAKVLARLLQNQQDLGNAIKPFYGDATGNKFTDLLTQHILLAGKVVDAAIKGNQADVAANNKLWYQNADEVAKFLGGINPNWKEQELKDIWHKHLQLITTAMTTRLAKDWTGDIAAFDEGEQHMIHFADVMADGIAKQFPDKFK
ncbi:glycosyltransferase [Cohnella soli]|uniref:Glycosyltransferase n=1 Tax=Cohnella soli TaxID=425005 RepID=A0ABW0HSH2_9BACL